MTQPVPRNTYLRVAESLRGVLKVGGYTERLPTVAQLADMYAVSTNVVHKALHLLKDEGLVEPYSGVAWYVAGTKDFRPSAVRLTEFLRTGGFEVGDRFPSEHDLAGRFSMSRTAIRKGLADLEERGYLLAVQGTRRAVLAIPQ